MRVELLVLAGLVACATRDATTPPLLHTASPSDGRDAYFEALGTADYDRLDGIIDTLQTEADAGDAVSLATLGFAHAWRLSEWRRRPDDANVTDHARWAMEAFDDAVDAVPDDARLVGFRGSFRQATGTIEERGGLVRRGWFDTVESARRWPEWGLFTQAYGLVTLEPETRRFEKGITLLWENLDECADTEVPRENMDWTVFADRIDDDFDVRACTNTPVAPHNIEGFFFVFGDFYAKKGDLANAKMMYENAVAMDDGTWPWRTLTDHRLATLDTLPDRLNRTYDEDDRPTPEDMLVFGSIAGCTICHQAE
ncbi:MAG: hypothetical protein AAGA48_22455 [Myxococcota bacterium]